jgi:hypothetical protein
VVVGVVVSSLYQRAEKEKGGTVGLSSCERP